MVSNILKHHVLFARILGIISHPSLVGFFYYTIINLLILAVVFKATLLELGELNKSGKFSKLSTLYLTQFLAWLNVLSVFLIKLSIGLSNNYLFKTLSIPRPIQLSTLDVIFLSLGFIFRVIPSYYHTKNYIKWSGYFIGIVPFNLTMYIAFSLGLLQLRTISKVLEDYFNFMKSIITKGFSTHERIHGANIPMDNRIIVIQEFEKLYDTLNNFNQTYGPILLTMFLNMALNFVMIMDRFLLYGTGRWSNDIKHEFLTLLCHGFQLYIIEMGHSVHQQVVKRVQCLKNLAMDSDSSPNKDDTKEIIFLLEYWDWKVSVGGFFSLDRSLVPLVLAFMMAYIIVLFQLP